MRMKVDKDERSIARYETRQSSSAVAQSCHVSSLDRELAAGAGGAMHCNAMSSSALTRQVHHAACKQPWQPPT